MGTELEVQIQPPEKNTFHISPLLDKIEKDQTYPSTSVLYYLLGQSQAPMCANQKSSA